MKPIAPNALHSGACAARSGFLADRRGNVAILFALAVLPLMASMGLAVDAGRAYLVQNRMAKALDAAGLAAARVVLEARAETDARRFFDANFPPGYLGSTVADFRYEVDESNEFVTVAADVTVPTVIMQLFGRDTIAVADTAVVERMNRGLELALVLDVTGSMNETEMTWLRDSSHNLVDILFGDEDELDLLWISVVPYTSTVNIGAHRTDWLAPSDRVLTSSGDFGPSPWKGCVMRRPLDRDLTDDPPATAHFTSFFYADEVDNDWISPTGTYTVNETRSDGNNMRGPNLGCGPEILGLTNVRATVDAAIAGLQSWSRGGTSSNLGMVWGWRTLSERWQGLWGGATPANMPLPNKDPLMDKAVVLMTDGENQFYRWPKHYEYQDGKLKIVSKATAPGGSDFTAFGRLSDLGATDISAGAQLLNDRTAAICQAMKDEGIIIFTITFGVGSSTIQNLFRDCASAPENYFNTSGAAKTELYAAFSAIGQRLSNLRIVQ